jgi:hypothetical protein
VSGRMRGERAAGAGGTRVGEGEGGKRGKRGFSNRRQKKSPLLFSPKTTTALSAGHSAATCSTMGSTLAEHTTAPSSA